MCYTAVMYSEVHSLSAVSCFFLDLKLVQVYPDGKTTQIYNISGKSYSCTQPACDVPIYTIPPPYASKQIW